ncbi:hypothetical protein MRX96_015592 [Rhipicephalus microplus]
MSTIFRFTVLALITATRTLCNAAEMNSEESARTSQEVLPNVFKEFWKNHTKVWTVKSTHAPLYDCEREVFTSVNDTSLQTKIYFDTENSLNWTFTGNDTITSELSEHITVRRGILYQNGTCAVFKTEVTVHSRRKVEGNSQVQSE